MLRPFPNGCIVAMACCCTILLILCLGCGGASSHTTFTSPPPTPPVVTPAPVGGIQPSFFGFQCGTGDMNCPNETWPNSVAQPGTLRLWDSGTFWNDIETAQGQYNGFGTLDGWLDTIAAENKSSVWATPVNVIYTFGFVACAEVANCRNGSPSNCSSLGTFKGCIVPPDDFTGTLSGSESFNNFVTALVQHCSPAGNCVKDLIKNYELWNEPNNPNFWHDTSATGELEVYRMVYPAVKIIRDNVPKSTVMTMASTVDAQYTAQWLQYENTYPPAAGGTLSDVVAWHQYLNVSTSEVAPDDASNISRLNEMLKGFQAVPGWASKPWRITETGFQAYQTPFNCTGFSTSDCIGHMVRWQLIVLSGNSQGMDWYSWKANIGSQPNYAEAWSFMMKNLLGGTFTSPCSSPDNATWTCSFSETSGKKAQWVWSTNSSGGSYSVPSGYSSYSAFNVSTSTSGSTPVSTGQSINITTMPLMLVQ